MISLMVQGTTSDAGKSTLVAGLGRVFVRRGINVAPFKPQNMALNSAVSSDGGEIGRAQALQAIACNIAPHSDMNPVLIKPSSDTQAQIIIQGKVAKALPAEAYHAYKKVAMQAVLQSYQRLQQQYSMLVVEGAGSPAEINLRDNDIANMGFAEAVDCPVILVADIDRGGVFAHIIGTLELLSASEQNRIIGFVINRFRGDIKLLESGLSWLEQKTGKPVLAVLPYLHNLHLDAEDAIDTQQQLATDKKILNVLVPVLPRMSNHTDFMSLRLHEQVNLQFVAVDQALPPATDLIILPGSKNVRDDLAYLKKHGWQQHIQRHLRYGGKLLGICGGYQMLGQYIDDSEGVEGQPGRSQALGLLDSYTVLKADKQLKQVQGKLCLSGQEWISGYEIHCGETYFSRPQKPLIVLEDGREEGVLADDQQIAGTYMHGLFDQPQAVSALLSWAGLQAAQTLDLAAIREQQIERLADCIEQNLEVDKLQTILQQFYAQTTAGEAHVTV